MKTTLEIMLEFTSIQAPNEPQLQKLREKLERLLEEAPAHHATLD